MQRYDTYKDSGVKWLGEIPEHWEVKRLASYFTERRVKVSDKDFEPLSVTKQGVFPQWENVAKTNDGDNRKLVKKGDFVINSRSDRKGSSGVSDRDGSVSLINIVLQPRKTILAQYSNYLLKSYRFIEEYYRNGRGIVADLWTTRYDEMKMIKLAIPPLDEQEAIANYLDIATAKIDAAIAQQQKMIDLLNERKQIIINRAVTKGLNPNSKMKDSGVEWIGEMPEGWELDKLKLYYSFEKGKNAQIYTNEYVGKNPGEYPVYSGQTENNGVMGLIDSYDYDIDECLFTTTVGAKVMTPRILKGRFSLSQNCLIMTRRREINNEYVYFFLLSMFPHKKALIPSHMQPSLRVEDMRTYKVLVPPIQEQKEIAQCLDNQCDRIDRIIEDCDKQIDLLQERKQIIINEVVTGKVKVV